MELHQCKWKNCDFVADDLVVLLNHAKNHVGFKRNKTFINRCLWENCSFSKESRAKITEHIISHINVRPHRCRACSSSFKNSRHLSKHAKERHSSAPEALMEYSTSASKPVQSMYLISDSGTTILNQIYEYPQWSNVVPPPLYNQDTHKEDPLPEQDILSELFPELFGPK